MYPRKLCIVLIHIILFYCILSLFQCAGGIRQVEKLDLLVPVVNNVGFYQGQDYTAFQTGAVRVYFSPWLPVGFSGMEDESDEMLMNFYQKSLNDLAVYFRMGIINGEMFYEKYKGYRRLLDKWQGSGMQSGSGDNSFQPLYADDLQSYNGLGLKVLYFEQDMGLESAPFVRLYNIWVQLDKTGDAWGEIDHYILLVTLPNGNAKEYTMLYEGASLTGLEYNLEK